MGAKDHTEQVLRSLHILLSRSPTYPREPSKVIIDKEQMVGLLNELSTDIYEMMNEFEMTIESRNVAEREFQKQGDEIVLKASRRAEDVYAASVMYTDEALNSIQDIMDDTAETMRILYEDMERRMKEEKQSLRSNQLELRSQLQDLADTEKYMKIIEDRNRQIEKEKNSGKDPQLAAAEKNIYADRSTGIRINKEYFAMMGIPLEDEAVEDEAVEDEAVQPDQMEMMEPLPESAEIAGIQQEEAELSPHEKTAQGRGSSKRGWGGFWRGRAEEQTEQEDTFEIQDLALDDEIADLGLVIDSQEPLPPDPELAQRAAQAQVRVDLDADYFRWKEQQEKEASAGYESGEPAGYVSEESVGYEANGSEDYGAEESADYEPVHAGYEAEDRVSYDTEAGIDYAQGDPGAFADNPAYEPDISAYQAALEFQIEPEYQTSQEYPADPESAQLQQLEEQSQQQAVHGQEQSEEEIEEAAREADQELSAGIHAIWQSLTNTIKEEEAEKLVLNEEENEEDM